MLQKHCRFSALFHNSPIQCYLTQPPILFFKWDIFFCLFSTLSCYCYVPIGPFKDFITRLLERSRCYVQRNLILVLRASHSERRSMRVPMFSFRLHICAKPVIHNIQPIFFFLSCSLSQSSTTFNFHGKLGILVVCSFKNKVRQQN